MLRACSAGHVRALHVPACLPRSCSTAPVGSYAPLSSDEVKRACNSLAVMLLPHFSRSRPICGSLLLRSRWCAPHVHVHVRQAQLAVLTPHNAPFLWEHGTCQKDRKQYLNWNCPRRAKSHVPNKRWNIIHVFSTIEIPFDFDKMRFIQGMLLIVVTDLNQTYSSKYKQCKIFFKLIQTLTFPSFRACTFRSIKQQIRAAWENSSKDKITFVVNWNTLQTK